MPPAFLSSKAVYLLALAQKFQPWWYALIPVSVRRFLTVVYPQFVQKISVLQHNPTAHLPSRPGDPTPTARNLDPLMHPFARARERIRAVNAAKLERMFAKPFVASLDGHADAVETLARRPNSLGEVASASWDGGVCVPLCAPLPPTELLILSPCTSEIVVHDIARRTKLARFEGAHKGKVSGLCYADEERLLSCGVDRTVKLWSTRSTLGDAEEAGPSQVRICDPSSLRLIRLTKSDRGNP